MSTFCSTLQVSPGLVAWRVSLRRRSARPCVSACPCCSCTNFQAPLMTTQSAARAALTTFLERRLDARALTPRRRQRIQADRRRAQAGRVGDANVYKQIAVALKPGAWRKAGLATIVPKLAQGGGERRPITAECMSWITATKCADKVLPIKHQVNMPSARDLREREWMCITFSCFTTRESMRRRHSLLPPPVR